MPSLLYYSGLLFSFPAPDNETRLPSERRKSHLPPEGTNDCLREVQQVLRAPWTYRAASMHVMTLDSRRSSGSDRIMVVDQTNHIRTHLPRSGPSPLHTHTQEPLDRTMRSNPISKSLGSISHQREMPFSSVPTPPRLRSWATLNDSQQG